MYLKIINKIIILDICWLFSIVNCFNLEQRLPIIKYGDKNTYFGYSVAAHIEGDKNQADNLKWLLVGAPLGQNLQPSTNHSGALYKCPMTSYTDDCVQVITDGRRVSGGIYESLEDDDVLKPPFENDEIKDGQWMGVTVKSQKDGGKVLVCAHRYITKMIESQYGQGLCYVLNNDLKYDEAYEPCKGRTVSRAHEEYGYCQVGTSGALLDDDTMVLGTPGPYTWRGTIFVISIGGEYLSRDKNQYYGPHTDSNSPVQKYSYLGMSVTGGRFFGSYMSYAAGAPRSNGHGQVVIFSKDSYMIPIKVALILDGEQFASSFGYELCTADINGDNIPDLIVAAPFYFTRHEGGAVYVYQNNNHNFNQKPTLKLTGKIESRFGLALANLGDINKDGCDDLAIGAPYEDNGAVYIYLGSKDGLSKDPSQIITASDLGLLTTPISTFGSSLSGSIDLDNNSYPDLLVGAYNSAAVVVLLARPITNIRTEIQSDELKNIDPTRPGCVNDPGSNLTCFSFKACCSIDPYESTPTTSLQLIYTIEAETYNSMKKFSRVFFGPETKKRHNIVKRNIRVLTNGLINCHEETVYIKDNTRDIQSPIKFRVNYTIVEPSLPSSGLIGLNPILDQTQADRPFEASFQKDCGTDDICESQLEVVADLELEKHDNQYSLILGKIEELALNINITNFNESAYEAQLFIEHQPSVSYIAASKGSVICNRFNKTIVSCTLGNPFMHNSNVHVKLRFDPSGLEDSEPKLSFRIFANSTSKQIIEKEDTVLGVTVIKRAELSIRGWTSPEQSFYGGEVKGESAMEYLDDIGSSVLHTYQIYNDGPWRAPYVEVHITWPHQVANDKAQGKWLLYLEEKPIIEGAGGGECFLSPLSLVNPLSLPKRAQVGDFRIPEMMSEPYMRRPVNKSYSYQSESYEKSYTISKEKQFESTSSNLNRVRRDRAMIIRADKLIDKDGKKNDVVHMDCEKNSAKCIKFYCVIYNMQRKTEAYLHIKARLWNSTLVSDYPRVDLVKIVSHATIVIPDMYGIQQNKQDDSRSIETRAYPELLDQVGDGSIPIWVVVVAALGGLLLLALLTYILWKFGFFKRKRPDPTLSGNLEKNNETKPFINK